MKETERREATTEEVERIFGALHLFYKQWGRKYQSTTGEISGYSKRYLQACHCASAVSALYC